MSLSDYLELKLLDHLFGNTAYSAPATLYLALFTVAPTDAGGGTEVSGGGYARKAVTNNATNWPAAASGSKSNGTVITFNQASANWGTVVAFGIFDASTGGNLLVYGSVSPGVVVNNADTASFGVGSLTITAN